MTERALIDRNERVRVHIEHFKKIVSATALPALVLRMWEHDDGMTHQYTEHPELGEKVCNGCGRPEGYVNGSISLLDHIWFTGTGLANVTEHRRYEAVPCKEGSEI